MGCQDGEDENLYFQTNGKFQHHFVSIARFIISCDDYYNYSVILATFLFGVIIIVFILKSASLASNCDIIPPGAFIRDSN